MDPICRCGWCGTDTLYVSYHDAEWGIPQQKGRPIPYFDHDTAPQYGGLCVVYGTTDF